MLFPSVSTFLQVFLVTLSWYISFLSNTASTLLAVAGNSLSTIGNSVMPVILAVPGLVAVMAFAVDGFFFCATLAQLAFGFTDGSLTLFDLVGPARKVEFASRGLYGKIFLMLVLTGPITAVVMLEVIGPFQNYADEANCYFVSVYSYLVSFLEFVQPVYRIVAPEISYLGDIVREFWEYYFGNVLRLLIAASRIAVNILSNQDEAVCIGTNGRSCVDYVEFSCAMDQGRCLFFDFLDFSLDGVFVRVISAIPRAGPTLGPALANLIRINLDGLGGVALYLLNFEEPGTCCDETNADTATCNFAGLDSCRLDAVGPPCCAPYHVKSYIDRMFDGYRNFGVILLNIVFEIPGIGDLIRAIFNLYTFFVEFINDNLIPLIDEALRFVLNIVRVPWNFLVEQICSILNAIPGVDAGNEPYCGWDLSIGSGEIMPRLPLPLPGEGPFDFIEFPIDINDVGLRRLLQEDPLGGTVPAADLAEAVMTTSKLAVCTVALPAMQEGTVCHDVVARYCTLGAHEEEEAEAATPGTYSPSLVGCLAYHSVFTPLSTLWNLGADVVGSHNGRSVTRLDHYEQGADYTLAVVATTAPYGSKGGRKAVRTRAAGPSVAEIEAISRPCIGKACLDGPEARRDRREHAGLGDMLREHMHAPSHYTPREATRHPRIAPTVHTLDVLRTNSATAYVDALATHMTVSGFSAPAARLLKSAGCDEDSNRCTLDNGNKLVFFVTNRHARLFLDGLIQGLSWAWDTLSSGTNFLLDAETFVTDELDSWDVEEFVIWLDDESDDYIRRQFNAIPRATALLQVFAETVMNLNPTSAVGFFGVLFRSLECDYNARTNAGGEWGFSCLLYLQLPPEIPFPEPPAPNIEWGVNCTSGQFTNEGFFNVIHQYSDGSPINCRCLGSQYDSCKGVVPSGSHLISGFLSGAFEYVSKLSIGELADRVPVGGLPADVAIPGTLLPFGIPELLDSRLTINLLFPPFPAIQYDERIVDINPVVKQFVYLGLNPEGTSSIYRNIFPGGLDSDVSTGTTNAGFVCLVVRTPAILKDLILIGVATALSMSLLFVTAVFTVAGLGLSLGLAGLPFVIASAVVTGYTIDRNRRRRTLVALETTPSAPPPTTRTGGALQPPHATSAPASLHLDAAPVPLHHTMHTALPLGQPPLRVRTTAEVEHATMYPALDAGLPYDARDPVPPTGLFTPLETYSVMNVYETQEAGVMPLGLGGRRRGRHVEP